MKLTFVLPPLDLSGGNRVLAIYAELMKNRGHDVVVICPPHGRYRSIRNFFRSQSPAKPSASHFDGKDLNLRVLDIPRPVRNADIENADAVIATWWETAEWVNKFSSEKGAKVYFIQHHEVHSLVPKERGGSTYRLPFHKVVVAKWLKEVMNTEYGDRHVDVVPNSVDHQQFFAAPRGKQDYPTVGLLSSGIDWKRFGLALEAIERVKTHVPDLRAHCFGTEHPPSPIPDFMSFSFNPPQKSLRQIYASCDVWLTASSSEGFNLPAMEAMACRTPVVATRTGWPAEAVVDGVNGACVAVDDLDALARETERVLKLSDAEWRRMSHQAFETVRESSWERSADLFEQALQRIVSRRTAIAV